MYNHKRNLVIGLLIAIFGVWLYGENNIGGCPSCSQISAAVIAIGLVLFSVSVIMYDQKEALKEEKGEQNQE